MKLFEQSEIDEINRAVSARPELAEWETRLRGSLASGGSAKAFVVLLEHPEVLPLRLQPLIALAKIKTIKDYERWNRRNPELARAVRSEIALRGRQN